jgi:hypothetical protein
VQNNTAKLGGDIVTGVDSSDPRYPKIPGVRTFLFHKESTEVGAVSKVKYAGWCDEAKNDKEVWINPSLIS